MDNLTAFLSLSPCTCCQTSTGTSADSRRTHRRDACFGCKPRQPCARTRPTRYRCCPAGTATGPVFPNGCHGRWCSSWLYDRPRSFVNALRRLWFTGCSCPCRATCTGSATDLQQGSLVRNASKGVHAMFGEGRPTELLVVSRAAQSLPSSGCALLEGAT